jgi:hypothetical protein
MRLNHFDGQVSDVDAAREWGFVRRPQTHVCAVGVKPTFHPGLVSRSSHASDGRANAVELTGRGGGIIPLWWSPLMPSDV